MKSFVRETRDRACAGWLALLLDYLSAASRLLIVAQLPPLRITWWVFLFFKRQSTVVFQRRKLARKEEMKLKKSWNEWNWNECPVNNTPTRQDRRPNNGNRSFRTQESRALFSLANILRRIITSSSYPPLGNLVTHSSHRLLSYDAAPYTTLLPMKVLTNKHVIWFISHLRIEPAVCCTWTSWRSRLPSILEESIEY